MKTTRRDFIKTVAIPMVAAPFVLPSKVWAAPPSNNIVMGFVGMGTQSRGLLGGFLHRCKVVAVCDVDTTRRTDAQEKVNKHYKNSDCKAYVDYRELMAMKDVNAVCIATPDHWHAAVTLAALKSGKDVYCEKPLTWCLQEAIDVIKAVDENKRVLQTGSMQRSMREFRVAAELVQNGCIGKISHVVCSFGSPPKPCDLKEEEMEKGLDWNMWLGPAPMRPYSSVLSPRGIHGHFPAWRNYREYGTGGVGDWGAHHLDIAQWGLGMDDSGPVEVCMTGKDGTLVYANGIKVFHKGGFGVHFFGSDGEVMVNRGKFKVIVKGQTIASNVDNDKTSCEAETIKAEKALLKDAKIKLYDSRNHQEDFVKCVIARTKPVTSEQIGGRTAICCHLLNQLYYNNKPFKWDPAKFAFAGGTGDPSWLTRQAPRDWAKK